jgi:hypothetical protein
MSAVLSEGRKTARLGNEKVNAAQCSLYAIRSPGDPLSSELKGEQGDPDRFPMREGANLVINQNFLTNRNPMKFRRTDRYYR